MNPSLRNLMRAATRLTQTGGLRQATEQIQRALKDAGLTGSAFLQPAGGVPPSSTSRSAGDVIDADVIEVDAAPSPVGRSADGDFIAGNHSHAGRTLAYKLYLPPRPEGRHDQPMPLVVMLHGCTQNPDDFAAGTGMNQLARAQGFCVLYPAQAQDANPSRCWNWFKHNHQARDGGEPAVIASLTQAVIQAHRIDADRVYVAGLSAGGAMAAILAGTYPEIFAAAGVHSGLPRGAARDMPAAFAVMKTGIGTLPAPHAARPVPTIVFHGDRDDTVHPLNGEKVIAAALDAAPAGHVTRVEQGAPPQGHRYTRHVHEKPDGSVLAEHWVVHGAGHAWSGGRPQGSYTDAAGPDASREMMRFFAAHGRPGTRS